MIHEWTQACFPVQPRHTLAHLKNILRFVWERECPGLDVPALRVSDDEGLAYTNGLDVIALPHQGQTEVILLHEIAHILELRCGRSGDHGPDFVSTVVRLYYRYLGADPDALISMALTMGVI